MAREWAVTENGSALQWPPRHRRIFFGTFVISSLLHRDPRYFVTLHGGAGHRIGYALSRIVVARTDDGRDATNWAGMLGPLLAESLANSYLSVEEQTAARTFPRYGIG